MAKIHGSLDILQLLLSPEYKEVARTTQSTKYTCTFCDKINNFFILTLLCYDNLDHPRYIEVNTGCRHFDVHGGPENIPVSRKSFDAKVCA